VAGNRRHMVDNQQNTPGSRKSIAPIILAGTAEDLHILKRMLPESIVEANEATEDKEETISVEDLVTQFMEVKKEKAAINAKYETLKKSIIEKYYEKTDFEGQVINVDKFDVVVTDQSRTGLWSKNLFVKKYGQQWVKEHLNTTYHARLSVSKKKR